jgi:beta-lactam-binding protein with PASTA domain
MKIRYWAVPVVAAGLLVAAAAPASAAPAAGDKFRMPNVVGMVLQDAQDLLQARGSYILDQEDARGLGRWQILDSGWKVCRQRPRPGAVVSTSATVTLWSVKLSERCPR